MYQNCCAKCGSIALHTENKSCGAYPSKEELKEIIR